MIRLLFNRKCSMFGVRVSVVYRRFTDWLASLHYEMNRMKPKCLPVDRKKPTTPCSCLCGLLRPNRELPQSVWSRVGASSRFDGQYPIRSFVDRVLLHPHAPAACEAAKNLEGNAMRSPINERLKFITTCWWTGHWKRAFSSCPITRSRNEGRSCPGAQALVRSGQEADAGASASSMHLGRSMGSSLQPHAALGKAYIPRLSRETLRS